MIYFDNSATTRCADEAVDIMKKCLQEDFGNPSSLHSMGAKGKDYLKESREIIAEILFKTFKVKGLYIATSEKCGLYLYGKFTKRYWD